MNLQEAQEKENVSITEIASKCHLPKSTVYRALAGNPIGILDACLIIDMVKRWFQLDVSILTGPVELPRLELTGKFHSLRLFHKVSIEDIAKYSSRSVNEILMLDRFSEGGVETIRDATHILGILGDFPAKIEDLGCLLLNENPDFSRLNGVEDV